MYLIVNKGGGRGAGKKAEQERRLLLRKGEGGRENGTT